MLNKFKQKIIFIIHKPLVLTCLGEFFGTYILMTIGLGTVMQRVLRHQFSDSNDKDYSYLTLPTGWSTAFILSQIISNIIGYGSMNPATTLSFTIIGRIPLHYLLPLTTVQLIGSFCSSLVLFITYRESITDGNKNCLPSAAADDDDNDGGNRKQCMNTNVISLFVLTPSASHYVCFIDRVFVSTLTTLFVLLLRDKGSHKVSRRYRCIYMAIFTIGRIGALSMNAGTSVNPSRDLGPRLAIAICGWGLNAFKANNYYFWIPIVAPYLGSIIGAILYKVTHFQCQLE
ncbi:unnamed protein product [Trichobilharzia szidati]|nr:unnamed protein product [Trichobilharzia szidati]